MPNNRRDFLKILGLGLAATTASPVMASIPSLKKNARPLKVGLMLSQSNQCPEYPASFLNGFRLGIDQNKALKKQQIEILNEPNEFGTPFITKQNTRKLLYENNVDLMVGLLGGDVAGQIEEFFVKKQVPCIVCNAGENFQLKQLRDNSWLFFNSLNLYQSSYMTGKFGVANYGRKALVVTSFYDSGYDALYTFYKGVEDGNGLIEDTVLMKQNEKDFVARAIARIKELSPDFVYVYLSGDKAREFIIQYKLENLDSIPMLTTQFVADQTFVPTLGNYADQLEYFSTWDKKMSNKQNNDFVKIYLNQYRAIPNLFAVLGYETGLLTYRAIASCNGDYSGEKLKSAISDQSFQSPRGEFSFNPETGWAQSQVNRFKLEKQLLETIPHAQLMDVPRSIPSDYDGFESLDNPYRSGWLNPYLFV